ncbi:hypothetical protein PAPYR_4500 [Paratrimastix pyriformis]|uniref:Uncharacterized protein n=1 Tax=Paratrimastix pyriformis TaxID=342808 RepID=A0ABQ8UQ32_9EUKA|nr:hypothetical protein PAPYR_4500 [Paratrimastix pyriformis]
MEISYLSDGDVFSIAADASFEDYLKSCLQTGTQPRPSPLSAGFSSAMMSEKVSLVLSVEGAKKRRVPFLKSAGFEALKSLIAREFGTESLVKISYLSDGDVFGGDSARPASNPVVNKRIYGDFWSSRITTSARNVPTAKSDGDNQAAHDDHVKQIPNDPPEPLPALAMCTLRLEAVGLPPRTVEIAPDQVEAMRLEEFMGLLATHFEGRSIAGAPAIGATPEAVTGLVDSAESLHSVLRASLAQPVVLQVPLRPLPPSAAKAERKKPKKQKPKESPHAAEPPQQQAAHAHVAASASPPRGGGPPTDLAGRIRALVSRLALTDPVDADMLTITTGLQEIIRLVREDFRAAAARCDLPTPNPAAQLFLGAISHLLVASENTIVFGRAGVVAPLVKLLTANPTMLTTSPETLEQLLTVVALLSDHSELRAGFGRAGVAAPLVRLLAADPNLLTASPAVAEKLLVAITGLAAAPENMVAFGRAGVAAPLVRWFTDHPDLPASNPALAEHLLGAIAHLAVDPANMVSFARAGLLVPLVRLLTSRTDLPTTSPGVAEVLLLAIRNLAADTNNRAAFGRAGVVVPLVRLISANPQLPATRPAVSEQLLGAVANLSVDAEDRASFGRAGIVVPLVKLLTAHPQLATTYPGVAEVLLGSIANIADDLENSPAFGRAGVIVPLVRLLAAQPNLPTTSPGVAEQLLAAIARLSAHPENNAAFGRAGVAAPLVKLLAANPNLPNSSPFVTEMLLRVLLMMAMGPNRAAMVAARPHLERFLAFPRVNLPLVQEIMRILAA